MHDENGSVPWPSMRGDVKNSGTSRLLQWKGKSDGESSVFRFRTGNSIFSTPVIDAKEIIYVGSADRKFYALDPLAGVELWQDDIGGIIDSAACIDVQGNIYLAAGDGKIHAYARGGEKSWSKDFLHDRTKNQFSLSSNFWFEANIVIGPDGWLYAANDDFFLYKVSPGDGSIAWGFRTGFLLWSAPSFGRDGCAYLAGFDHMLYAIDTGTGKKRWSLDLHGALVSSAAVDAMGMIYVGSFNGNVYCIDPGLGDRGKGSVEWTFHTSGHVYASPAVAPDGTVYVGSSSGTFHAIEAKTGTEKWNFYTGDAIRCSAAVGVDPEGKHEYLVYFGAGDGVVYALTPGGTLRWAYDTVARAKSAEYPNINASIALGSVGLSTATAGGDVLWIPYDYYLENPGDPAIMRGDLFTARRDGPAWHWITPGGRLSREAMDAPVSILPVNTMSVRLLVHGERGTRPAVIDPGSVNIVAEPPFDFTWEVQSNGSTLNVIPERMVPPGTDLAMSIEATYGLEGGDVATCKDTLKLTSIAAEESPGPCPLVSTPGRVFNIVHMAIPQPPIIPSLNQIGFASLVIPFVVIDHDPARRVFVAWAVQEFKDYVPQERVSVYAFGGEYDGKFFTMEAVNCLFEITAFTIPLDRLRFAARVDADGHAGHGGSLLVEKRLGFKPIKLVSELGTSSPITPGLLLRHLKQVGPTRFFSALIPFLRSLRRLLFRDTFVQWGLVNHRGQLTGAGTFKIEPGTPGAGDDRGEFEVLSFEGSRKKRRVVATVKCPSADANAILRILLVDKDTMKPLPLNYNAQNKQRGKGDIVTATLTVPKSVEMQGRDLTAYLMNSLAILASIPLS